MRYSVCSLYCWSGVLAVGWIGDITYKRRPVDGAILDLSGPSCTRALFRAWPYVRGRVILGLIIKQLPRQTRICRTNTVVDDIDVVYRCRDARGIRIACLNSCTIDRSLTMTQYDSSSDNGLCPGQCTMVHLELIILVICLVSIKSPLRLWVWTSAFRALTIQVDKFLQSCSIIKSFKFVRPTFDVRPILPCILHYCIY